MNASKENARTAIDMFAKPKPSKEDRQFIADFLFAASNKLPSEAAFERDKQRKKPAQG